MTSSELFAKFLSGASLGTLTQANVHSLLDQCRNLLLKNGRSTKIPKVEGYKTQQEARKLILDAQKEILEAGLGNPAYAQASQPYFASPQAVAAAAAHLPSTARRKSLLSDSDREFLKTHSLGELNAKLAAEKSARSKATAPAAVAPRPAPTAAKPTPAAKPAAPAPVSRTPLADQLAKLSGADASSFYRANSRNLKIEAIKAKHPNAIILSK